MGWSSLAGCKGWANPPPGPARAPPDLLVPSSVLPFAIGPATPKASTVKGAVSRRRLVRGRAARAGLNTLPDPLSVLPNLAPAPPLLCFSSGLQLPNGALSCERERGQHGLGPEGNKGWANLPPGPSQDLPDPRTRRGTRSCVVLLSVTKAAWAGADKAARAGLTPLPDLSAPPGPCPHSSTRNRVEPQSLRPDATTRRTRRIGAATGVLSSPIDELPSRPPRSTARAHRRSGLVTMV